MNLRLLLPLFAVCATGVAQTVEATEEAIVNAMVGAQTMTGVDGHSVEALPHDKLTELMKRSPQARYQ